MIHYLHWTQVFKLLSDLKIPDFTKENWQSTIRGELRVSAHFANLSNWHGRETADLVYLDQTGELTQFLRDRCKGGFPQQVGPNWNFEADPIEYYLEVKTSTTSCETRFYMSGAQYDRVSHDWSICLNREGLCGCLQKMMADIMLQMESMALRVFQRPTKIYVILRVFHLMSANVGLKIFVDPFRFKGSILDFETENWHVYAR